VPREAGSWEGQFVGVMLSVLNNQWGGWNEGDEMIWIDGEKERRIHGTGGEDYFNAAWGFNKLYATPPVEKRIPKLVCTGGPGQDPALK
jgi:hypothetical protein